MNEEHVDNFLEHFGVKGMHWGQRKSEESSSSGSMSTKVKPKKLTRKEVKAERNAFYQDKSNRILETASKDPEALIKVRTPFDTVPSIVTGQEFMDYMKRGGYMDIRVTDIWAQKDSSGTYILNENMNQKFVRSDKIKK